MKPALSKFKIYTKETCYYCVEAKRTFQSLGLTYEEVKLEESPADREMLKSQGFRTVPQIYLGEDHIGGYTELVEYLQHGKEVHTRQSA